MVVFICITCDFVLLTIVFFMLRSYLLFFLRVTQKIAHDYTRANYWEWTIIYISRSQIYSISEHSNVFSENLIEDLKTTFCSLVVALILYLVREVKLVSYILHLLTTMILIQNWFRLMEKKIKTKIMGNSYNWSLWLIYIL